jgi:hypothetical protein
MSLKLMRQAKSYIFSKKTFWGRERFANLKVVFGIPLLAKSQFHDLIDSMLPNAVTTSCPNFPPLLHTF